MATKSAPKTPENPPSVPSGRVIAVENKMSRPVELQVTPPTDIRGRGGKVVTLLPTKVYNIGDDEGEISAKDWEQCREMARGYINQSLLIEHLAPAA